MLNDVMPSCPRCGTSLSGHQYQQIAATTLTPEALDHFRELLSAIRHHEWQRVVTFQDWKGDQANAEVYVLKCADGTASVVVISAPFALEEPYTLMHYEPVGDASWPEVLPSNATWRAM